MSCGQGEAELSHSAGDTTPVKDTCQALHSSGTTGYKLSFKLEGMV